MQERATKGKLSNMKVNSSSIRINFLHKFFLENCAGCTKPLLDDGFFALGQLYHKNCFRSPDFHQKKRKPKNIISGVKFAAENLGKSFSSETIEFAVMDATR